MSLGYGGHATLVEKDERGALYAYGSYNLADKCESGTDDGSIYIELAPVLAARKIIRSRSHPEGTPLREGIAENLDYEGLLEKGP